MSAAVPRPPGRDPGPHLAGRLDGRPRARVRRRRREVWSPTRSPTAPARRAVAGLSAQGAAGRTSRDVPRLAATVDRLPQGSTTWSRVDRGRVCHGLGRVLQRRVRRRASTFTWYPGGVTGRRRRAVPGPGLGAVGRTPPPVDGAGGSLSAGTPTSIECRRRPGTRPSSASRCSTIPDAAMPLWPDAGCSRPTRRVALPRAGISDDPSVARAHLGTPATLSAGGQRPRHGDPAVMIEEPGLRSSRWSRSTSQVARVPGPRACSARAASRHRRRRHRRSAAAGGDHGRVGDVDADDAQPRHDQGR